MKSKKQVRGEESPVTPSPLVNEEVSKRRKDLLGPGFLIRLSSLDDKRLNGTFRIRFDGSLSLPYDVIIRNVSQMTLAELSSVVHERYRPFFTGQVHIQVSLAEKKAWVDVRGLVQSPGKHLVDLSSSLDEVVAKAGGVQTNSDAGEVFVKRIDGSELVFGLGSLFGLEEGSNFWSGGEVVIVRPAMSGAQMISLGAQSRTIQVLGEVRKPGVLAFKEGADLLHYFTLAEGPTSFADLERIDIVRGALPGASRYQVKWSRLNQAPKLEPGDIVIVRAREPTWWADKVLPIVSSVSTVVGTVLLLILVL